MSNNEFFTEQKLQREQSEQKFLEQKLQRNKGNKSFCLLCSFVTFVLKIIEKLKKKVENCPKFQNQQELCLKRKS
jgi:hypothetical protein